MFKPYYITEPLDGEVTKQMVIEAVAFNEAHNTGRIANLENYYNGNHEIANRVTQSGVNNKVIINHAKLITDTNVGYLLGNPVDYRASDKYTKTIDEMLVEYREQIIANLDVKIAKHLSKYGVYYELVYFNESSQPRSAGISPANCILARNNKVTHDKIFAVIYNKRTNGEIDADVYTKGGKYTTVISKDLKKASELIKSDLHEQFAPIVPVIEYWNNDEGQGDYEQVISLIDAYNKLQSDRVNDKEQLVDAILAFYGMDFTAKQARALKEGRIIANIPVDGKIEFLTKQLNEADTDVLRQTLERDILKIAMTPNMADENFVGNASGVAIRYKLLTFEQNIKNKERFFETGLRDRLQIYNSALNKKQNTSQLPNIEFELLFKRNLPTNDYEISQMINNLVGLVDAPTLVGQLSFVRDSQEAVDLAKAEAQAQADNKDDISDDEINLDEQEA